MPTTPTRRSNGEGSTPYQRGDGRWQINLRIPAHQTTTGEPFRKSITGPTRADVVAASRTIRQQITSGARVDPTRTTLTDWITHWLEHIAPTRARERTVYGYGKALGKWVTSTPIGDVPLERLTSEHVEQIYTRMREAGSSEANVKALHRVLSRCLWVAVQRGRLGTNPAERVETGAAARFSPAVLTPQQARTLIQAAQEDPVTGPSWVVALALGLRQGERLGLEWADVDLARHRLRVRQELGSLVWKHGCGDTCGGRRGADCPDRFGGGYQLMPTKSAAGDRVVPLPQVVVEALQRQRALQDRWRVEAGESWAPLVLEG